MKKLAKFIGIVGLAMSVVAGCGKKENSVSNQCKDSVFTQNVSDQDLFIVQPNAISPNGDGVNDVFFVVAYYRSNPQRSPTFAVRQLTVTRPGSSQRVYYSSNYQNTFNGHDDAGNLLPEGDYFFNLVLDNNSSQGNVKIVRTTKACNCRTVDTDDEYLASSCR
jgi:hypothetical protein